MTWKEAAIEGCIITPLKQYNDARGWLAEFFRQDELDEALYPVMGYVSTTRPGIARGPHEHVAQTDLFLFFSGLFTLYMWDARRPSPTYAHRMVVEVGESNPVSAIVPPGVVHAYRNDGSRDAFVINCPNALYAGEGKKQPVDEIRHEDIVGSPYLMD